MALTELQFNEIYELYLKAVEIHPKPNGWVGYDGYSSPGRFSDRFEGYIPLNKISFEVNKSKTKPTDALVETKLKEELIERIERASNPFVSGVFDYFKWKNRKIIFGFMDSIQTIVEKNSNLILECLESKLEHVTINELYQRIKDHQCYQEYETQFEDQRQKIIDEAIIRRKTLK